MFSITVFLGDTIAPVVLLYKGEDTMNAALESVSKFDSMVFGPNGTHPSSITKSTGLADDFGQRLDLMRPPMAILVQDLKQAQEADIIRGIHQAVTQAKAQDRAKEDPVLKEHFRRQQSPAVFSPMGGQVGGPRFNG